MQTWDTAQVQRFLAAAQSAYGPIWAVLHAIGPRRGEVLGLRPINPNDLTHDSRL